MKQDPSIDVPGPFSIRVLKSTYTIAQLPGAASVPDWATGEFVTITMTSQELSVVCPSENVPDDVRQAGDWKCLHIDAVMDFSLLGVLAHFCSALADAGVSVFACSTFDTDYLLVQAGDLPSASAVLRAAGHAIVDSGD